MIERAILSKLQAAVKDSPAVILHGARQTGKTTLVKQLAELTRGPKYAYITLDDLQTRALIERDPSGFVTNLPERVILDEIQLAPDAFRAIKLSIDENRKPGRFILTGSANALLIPKLADALVGRVELHALYPLSQSEIEQTRSNFIDTVFAGNLKSKIGNRFTITKADLAKRVAIGGYPEVVLHRRNGRHTEWFNSYINTIIQRDIRDLADIEGLAMLPRTLALLAARAANLSNLAELTRTLGIPHTTLKRYLALFEATFLLQLLPAWSGNIGKRMVKAGKIMLTDTGLLCHLMGIDDVRLSQDSYLFGQLLENFGFTEIKKQSTWAKTDVQLMHFRTHTDQEVDIVLEHRDGRLFGIEIKSTATPTAKDFSGLELLRETLGDRFIGGALLCTSNQVLPVSDRIVSAPISILWQL